MPEHFIVAGAQRCGTTYLYRLLDAHPEILMAKPLRPEPKYFLATGACPCAYDEYLRLHFPERSRYRLLGEKSVAYMERRDAAERIRQTLPRAKIIIILRDPVSRAVSNFWFTKNYGLEKRGLEECFATLIDKEPDLEARNVSISPYRYLARGHYVRGIEIYEKLFGKDRLKILILENFAGNRSELEGLYRFLGADPSFLPDRIGMADNESEKTDEKISPGTLARLVAYFRESNVELARRYGVGLSKWRQ